MATHDYVIDNSTGANVRADINSVLQAILTNNSSSSAPSTTAAYMFWADTTSGTLKIRNSSDNAWVELLQLDGTLTLEDGSASTPALAFRDDLNTGIFQPGNNQLAVSCNGTEVVEFGTSEAVFNDTGADINFRIEGDTDANLLFVDAGNDRIGIGTSSPASLVHLSNDTDCEIRISNTDTTLSDGSQIGRLSFYTSDTTTPTGAGEVFNINSFSANSGADYTTTFFNRAGSAGGSIMLRFVEGSMRFSTSPAGGSATERMRIDSSGKVGIGTSTPSDFHSLSNVVIHSSGDTGLTISSGTSNDGRLFFADGTSGSAESEGVIRYDHADDKMYFGTADTDRLTIDSSGNVGIGDTSPAELLTLRDATPRIRLEDSDTTNAACQFVGDNASVLIQADTAGVVNDSTISFAIDAAERMRIDSSGRVLIGLTSSAANASIDDLQVGNPNSSNQSGITIGSNDEAAIAFSNAGDARAGSITYNMGSDAFIFKTNGQNERMRIDSSGKMMMGTTGSLDMGFGIQVLSIRGGNTAGYDGTAAAIFGQLDNDAATCIFYNASSTNGTNMLDTRCARSNNSAYTFHIMRSNSASDTEFRWRGDGNAFADGSFSGGGADYAEYFEWSDGNSSDEDRRGYTVVLDGNKIRKSTSSDTAATIIGVVSGNPSVVGDTDLDKWKQKYKKDDYGTYLRDSNGERVLNSDWDESIEYVSREDRKEWSTVGLMGKIRIRKGQTMGTNWIKMQDISDTVEEWLVR